MGLCPLAARNACTFLLSNLLEGMVDKIISSAIILSEITKEADMTFGIMGYGSWLDFHYIIPRPLISESNSRYVGFQQYRWLKFFFTVSR